MNIQSRIEIKDAIKKYDINILTENDRELLRKILYIDKSLGITEKEALFIANIWGLDYEVQRALKQGFSPKGALLDWDILNEGTLCKSLNNKFKNCFICLEDIYSIQGYEKYKNQYCMYLYLKYLSSPQRISFNTLEEMKQLAFDIKKEVNEYYETQKI